MDAEKIRTVVVVGGGIMGQGIAQNFAQVGIRVQIVDINKTILNDCRNQININLRLFKEFNLLREDIGQIESRIDYFLTDELTDISKHASFILEAIPEVLELKKKLFHQLDSCPEDIILASNTSSFTIDSLSEGCRTASRIIGVHYFNPAHIMPLVEIHCGSGTSPAVISATKSLIIRVGKKPILVRKEVPGFIVNRIQTAMGREILHLLKEGVASIDDIDTASKASYGFRYANIGSIEAIDMIGTDTVLTVSKFLYKYLDSSIDEPALLADMVKRGELGVKSGKGFYNYTGKSRSAILEEQNRKLLRQLDLFNEMESHVNQP